MQDRSPGQFQLFLFVFIAAVVGGGIPPLAKIALTVFPTFAFIFIRYIIAALLLIPVASHLKKNFHKKNLVPLIAVSLIGMANVSFFAFGVERTSATVAAVLYAAVPIIAVIASAIILKHQITLQTTLGIITGFTGVLIIILGPVISTNNIGNTTFTGNLLVAMAVISYSLYTVFSKRVLQHSSPLLLTAGLLFTTLTLLPFLMLTEITEYRELSTSVTPYSVVAIVYVGLATTVYIYLYQKVIKQGNPVVASVVFYLQPISSYIWAYILLGEKLNSSLIAGGILAIVGAGIVTWKRQQKKGIGIN